MKYFKGFLIILGLVCLVVIVANVGAKEVKISRHTPQSKTMECPSDMPIKGNAQSGIYHLPQGQYYDKTSPERCFSTETEAQEAGYRASNEGVTVQSCLDNASNGSDRLLIINGYTRQDDGSWIDVNGNYPTSEIEEKVESYITDHYNNCVKNGS